MISMDAINPRGLKAPLTALAVAVLLGIGLPYYSDSKLKDAKRELAQQQKQLSDARTKLNKSGDEKNIIVRFLKDYDHLQRIGFVGEEQRINWLDGLRLANQQTRLFGVDYQIGTQKPYPFANELNPGQMAIFQSEMKISFKLLHEEDLMRFLSALAKQGAGVFSVTECMMERMETGGSIRFQPNIRAECDLAWITMRPATTGDKKS